MNQKAEEKCLNASESNGERVRMGERNVSCTPVNRERLLARMNMVGIYRYVIRKSLIFHFVFLPSLETFNHRRFYGMTHSLFYVTCTIRYFAAFEMIHRTGDILAKR